MTRKCTIVSNLHNDLIIEFYEDGHFKHSLSGMDLMSVGRICQHWIVYGLIAP